MQVNAFIEQYSLRSRVETALIELDADLSLLDEIGLLPVRKSRAVRRFGAYVTKGREPVEIRLQFALELPELVETFLHELAHCLDHMTLQKGQPYRKAHGKGWQRWASALGVAPNRCCKSDVLTRLQEEKMKVVAICRKCGYELKRLRRLPQKRKFVHTDCGGHFKLL